MKLSQQQEFQLKKIENKLRKNNIRLTKIRIETIKIIIASDHPTTTDIINNIVAQFGKVNVMSVYNTLSMLLENDVLFANTFNGKQICYEIKMPESYHLKCDKCFLIVHADAGDEGGAFFEKFKKISKKSNWTCDRFKVEIHGFCYSCSQKEISN